MAPLHPSPDKTPVYSPLRKSCQCVAARSLVNGSGSCLQPVPLSGGNRLLLQLLWVTRTSSFLTPTDEFLSSSCTMSSPSTRQHCHSLFMAEQHRAVHICCPSSGFSTGQSAPGLQLPLPRCSSLEPEPAARWQLPPLGTRSLPKADFSTRYKSGGEVKYHPEILNSLAGFCRC